jgi:BMFP domain-containing protein YqiC
MSDAFDKVVTLGLGLEKKAKELLAELERLGTESRTAKAGEGSSEGAAEGSATGEEDLSSRKKFENKLVEGTVAAMNEFLSSMKECKEKLEREAVEKGGKFIGRMNVASAEDLDVVREMARVAREKVDALEKRVAELEGKGKVC